MSFFILPNALSQNLERYNWFFGAGPNNIRFNRTHDGKPTFEAKPFPANQFGRGGSVTVSDPRNANLLFYSDGNRVYDASHVMMPNGNLLTGSVNANQPAVACKIPGETSKYFIFTNSANFTSNTGGDISVSVVDLSLQGNATQLLLPLGDLESKNTRITALANIAEGMIIIPHGNGEDFWLITQTRNSSSYFSTLIDANSYPLTSASFSTITSANVGAITTVSNFSYHQGTNKIAVSPQVPNSDAQIFRIDNNTGTLTLDMAIPNTASTAANFPSISDMEWSLNGRNLYISKYGDNGLSGGLSQFSLDNSTLASVVSNIYRGYGLQIGPDSLIYYLYQTRITGNILIGTIANTDATSNLITYNNNPDFVPKAGNGFQFPSFAPANKEILTVNFTFTGKCRNSNTTFFPEVTPTADSLVWDFGDKNIASVWSPIHKYETEGTYNVTLKAYYHNQEKSITVPVKISLFNLKLQLVKDTTACHTEFPLPYNAGPTYSDQFSVTAKVTEGTATGFFWSNGDIGQTLTPKRPGNYYLIATDASGCAAFANVLVKDYNKKFNYTNTWYFGNKAGINFNESPPVPLNNSAMVAPEGCAIFSNLNGDPLFYSDGNSVYDRDHNQTDTGIGGDVLATQSATIIPFANDSTLFYLFTTQNINQPSTNVTKLSLFDIKINQGKGGLVKQNVPIFGRSTERLVANDKWLIFHEFGNNTFRVHSLTEKGIGNPILTAIGSEHPFPSPINGTGYMRLDDTNTLYVAFPTSAGNFVEIFKLAPKTGKLSDYKSINLIEPNGEVYGIEISKDRNKLFVSIKNVNGPSWIAEYNLNTNPANKLQRIMFQEEIGALSYGPDGVLYFAHSGGTSLGKIEVNESVNNNSTITLNSFKLATGTNSLLGLPQYNNQIKSSSINNPNITASDVCFGNKSKFSGTPTDNIDTYEWNFDDPTGEGNIIFAKKDTTHTYKAAKIYTVALRLTNRCGLDMTLTHTHTVFVSPEKPTLPPTANLCLNPSILLDANSNNIAGYTYLWNTGETTKTVTVTKPYNPISVTIKNSIGCESKGETVVVDSSPKIEIPATVSECQNSPSYSLDASNPGAEFVWTVNGTSISTNQTRPIVTSLVGEFVYKVEVTVKVDQMFCKSSASTTVTVLPIPNGSLPNNTTICNDGENPNINTNQVALDPGTFTNYYWYKDGITQNYYEQVYIATDAGKYKVEIVGSNGCKSEVTSVVINDCVPIVAVPTAFRPKTTIPENQYFRVISYHIKKDEFSVGIFNRWGEPVFSSENPNFEWNGGKNNDINLPLAGGEYGYIIKYISSSHPERGIMEKRGGVVLLR